MAAMFTRPLTRRQCHRRGHPTEQLDGDLVEIPFSFSIPDGLPNSQNRLELTYAEWRLQVEGRRERRAVPIGVRRAHVSRYERGLGLSDWRCLAGWPLGRNSRQSRTVPS